MRNPLLATATVAGLALATTVTLGAVHAAADPGHPHQRTYRDASVAGLPQLDVHGTVVPIDADGAHDEDRYVLRTAGGTLLPVSLDRTTPLTGPATFDGSVAVPSAFGARLARRGVRATQHRHVDGDTAQGRTALDLAAGQTTPLPVSAATLTTTAATTTPTAARLYVAVITNRGTIEESDATIQSDVDAMRSYWQTEAGSLLTSFTQPVATVRYASTAAAPVSGGCGIADPWSVWDEAAGNFPGVGFGANGNHLMVVVADDCSGSSGAGVGTIGSSLASGGETLVTLGSTAVAVGVHELGHNFSLQHANAMPCSTSCTVQGYDGVYSIMGLAVGGAAFTPPALDTAYRAQLGIAGAAEAPTVTAPATVHLAPRASSSGQRGFFVSAAGARYAVDYRSGTDRDASAFYASRYTLGNGYTYRPGVTVERVESDGSTTLLSWSSGITSLTAGQSLTLGSVTLTVTAATPTTGADVQVTDPATPAPVDPPTSTPPATVPPTTVSPTTQPPTTTPPTTVPPTTTPVLQLSAAPRVLGTPRVGVRLTATAGTWTPAPTAVGWQWLADGRAVATGPAFTPSAAQLGRRISVRVTVGRAGYPSRSAVSAPSARVAPGTFRTGTPSVHGMPRVGQRVTAATGTWTPSPAVAYRWYADGHPISGGTHPTLTVTRALRGRHLSVQVTAHRAGYTSATRTSSRTAPVR